MTEPTIDKAAPRPAIRFREIKAKCEKCSEGHAAVCETRPTTFGGRIATLRRRRCDRCGHKTRTFEMTDAAISAVMADQVALFRARVVAAVKPVPLGRNWKK